MVLAELGGKIRESLRRFQSSSSASMEEVNGLLSEISRALIESDVNVKLVMSLRDNVKAKVQESLASKQSSRHNNDQQLPKLVQQTITNELTKLLTPSKRPYTMKRGKSNILLFVGLQGAGKTTTIAKVAHYYSKRGWKTALVCADTFRAGALDQLKQNATKLRIPFYGSYTEADPVVIAQEGVAKFVKSSYECILVDTSGRHLQQASLLDEMQEISLVVRPHNTIFVMDATQGQAVHDQAVAFSSRVKVGSVIVTKLDGHAKGGGALSAVAATDSSILFLGTGEHFDDLEPFLAKSFINKLLGLADFDGLRQELASMSSKQSQKEMQQRLLKGQFSLRDMYGQFEKVLNMGSMQKLMGSVMGGGNNIPDYLLPHNEESTRRLRIFLYIMDSMNAAELDGKISFKEYETKPELKRRIRRIAAGSGTSPQQVELLLKTHLHMEKVYGKMGSAAAAGGNQAALQRQVAAQMKKNPNLLNQRLNQMDPKLIQQMGGREAVMQMMQSYAKGGPAAGAGGEEAAFASMMQSAMSGGGIPGLGGGIPGLGGGGAAGGMPDMQTMMKMMQQMGGGGMPGFGGGGGGGGGGSGPYGIPNL